MSLRVEPQYYLLLWSRVRDLSPPVIEVKVYVFLCKKPILFCLFGRGDSRLDERLVICGRISQSIPQVYDLNKMYLNLVVTFGCYRGRYLLKLMSNTVVLYFICIGYNDTQSYFRRLIEEYLSKLFRSSSDAISVLNIIRVWFK